MKAIMISGLPRWTSLIANGDKTIEIRTSKALANAIQKLIDKYGYADIYWYCSKNGGWLTRYKENNETKYCWYNKEKDNLNGKIIFKFRCYNLEKYTNGCKLDGDYSDYEYILKPSCLTEEELDDYCEDLSFYAIHISNLEIFVKPKKMSEFYNIVPSKLPLTRDIKYLTKAPQNFCYVEVEK